MSRSSILSSISSCRSQINSLHNNMNELRRKIQALQDMLAEHQNKARIYKSRVEAEVFNLNRIRNFEYIRAAQNYSEDMHRMLNGPAANIAINNLQEIENSIDRRIEDEYSRMQKKGCQM